MYSCSVAMSFAREVPTEETEKVAFVESLIKFNVSLKQYMEAF